MTLSSNPTKTEVNAIKTYIMNSFRYCKRVCARCRYSY